MKNFILTSSILGSLFVTGLTAAQGKIAQRAENQRDRIAQGVKSGQMTAGETARVEKKESDINKQVRAERNLNGGKLTAGERKQVNREQNRVSRKIYRDKHNAAVQK
ncbi:MAG: hypothetical protein KGN84_18180 [Acidobacteriota bacterium]|nr:hypothetical protein [Acidobacteriota bacterium]